MRRRILPLLALAALGACGGAVNPLAAAVSKTSRTEGVRLTLDADVTAAGSTMRMTGGGVMDMRGKRGHFTYRMALPPEVARQSGMGPEMEMEQITQGLVMYMKMPRQMAKEMPGGTRWMKIDMGKAGRAMGVDLQSMMQGGGTDPSQTLKWLEASDAVEEVGQERVGGVETTHYRADVALEDLAKEMPEDQRDAYRKSVRRMQELGAPSRIPMEVWISDDDLVRRMKYAFTQNVPNAGEMKMDFTMDFSDHGKKVRIPAPPDDAFDATDLASEGLREQTP